MLAARTSTVISKYFFLVKVFLEKVAGEYLS
jgi:hypothetical protein